MSQPDQPPPDPAANFHAFSRAMWDAWDLIAEIKAQDEAS